MRAHIEAKIVELQGELQRADEELAKLRPRVQYLESMLYRLDGALSALQNVLEPPAATPNGTPSMTQPVAS